jgi:hypothetical protein
MALLISRKAKMDGINATEDYYRASYGSKTMTLESRVNSACDSATIGYLAQTLK